MRNYTTHFIVLGAPLMMALTGCHSSARQIDFAVLDHSAESIRTRFNADRDRIRVVALLSPV